jgi:quinol monooxygenase YgiN
MFGSNFSGVVIVIKYALFVRLEAKPGKEGDVEKFLEAGLAMAREETTTPIWFALRLSPTTFGVFDSFYDEASRQAHLKGPIAQALIASAPDLLAAPPSIEPVEVLGLKNIGAE